MVARRKFATALLGAVAGLLLAAVPYDIRIVGLSPEAAAAPAGSGQGNNGNNGSSGGAKSGGSNSGGKSGGSASGGKSGGSNSESGKGKASDGGRGAEAGTGGSSGFGKSGVALPDTIFSDDFGKRSNEYINPVTGTRIEIKGSNVQVLHLDGIREEIMDGRYRMNDAQGRRIIERTATESDRARARALIR